MDTRRGLRSSKTTLVETTLPNDNVNDKEGPDAAFSDLIICSICDRKLGSKNSLKRHMRIHTGEKPFSCNSCQASFHRSDQLRAHKLTHFSMCYPCRYCKLELPSWNLLHDHIEYLHNNINKKNPSQIVNKNLTCSPPPLTPMPLQQNPVGHIPAFTHPPPLLPRPTILLNATEEERKLLNCSNYVPVNGNKGASTDKHLVHMVVIEEVEVRETSQNSTSSPESHESQMNEEKVDSIPHSLQYLLSPDDSSGFTDEKVKSQIVREESTMRSRKLKDHSQDVVLPSTHEQIPVASFACRFLPMRFRQDIHLQQHLQGPHPIEDIWKIADSNTIDQEELIYDAAHGSDMVEEAQLCDYSYELKQPERDINDRIAYTNRSSSSLETDQLHTCETCGKTFLLKKHLLQHMQTIHLFKLPMYQCTDCPKSYHIPSSLVTHRRRCHTRNPFSSAREQRSRQSMSFVTQHDLTPT